MQGQYLGDKDETGNRVGCGLQTYANGNVYFGDRKKDRKDGRGLFLNMQKHELTEGEWRGDNSSGCACQTSKDGRSYTGNFSSGYRHGIGRIIDHAFEFFGEFKRGCRDGAGMQRDKNKDKIVKSYYLEGLLSGFTVLKIKSRRYMFTGNAINGKFQGLGEEIADSAIYVGQFFDSRRHGIGYTKSQEGMAFLGTWEAGKRTGFGIEELSTGEYFEGEFLEDSKQGTGKFVDPAKGVVYTGYFADSKASGLGKLQSASMFYIGEWKEGKRNGCGYQRQADGKVYFGQWRQDLKHGVGYAFDDKTEFKGMFAQDSIHGRGILKMGMGKAFGVEFNKGQFVQYLDDPLASLMEEFDAIDFFAFESDTTARVDNAEGFVNRSREEVMKQFFSFNFDFKQREEELDQRLRAIVEDLKPVSERISEVRKYLKSQLLDAFLPWNETLIEHFSRVRNSALENLEKSKLDQDASQYLEGSSPRKVETYFRRIDDYLATSMIHPNNGKTFIEGLQADEQLINFKDDSFADLEGQEGRTRPILLDDSAVPFNQSPIKSPHPGHPYIKIFDLPINEEQREQKYQSVNNDERNSMGTFGHANQGRRRPSNEGWKGQGEPVEQQLPTFHIQVQAFNGSVRSEQDHVHISEGASEQQQQGEIPERRERMRSEGNHKNHSRFRGSAYSLTDSHKNDDEMEDEFSNVRQAGQHLFQANIKPKPVSPSKAGVSNPEIERRQSGSSINQIQLHVPGQHNAEDSFGGNPKSDFNESKMMRLQYYDEASMDMNSQQNDHIVLVGEPSIANDDDDLRDMIVNENAKHHSQANETPVNNQRITYYNEQPDERYGLDKPNKISVIPVKVDVDEPNQTHPQGTLDDVPIRPDPKIDFTRLDSKESPTENAHRQPYKIIQPQEGENEQLTDQNVDAPQPTNSVSQQPKESSIKSTKTDTPREASIKSLQADPPREASIKSTKADPPREASVKSSKADPPQSIKSTKAVSAGMIEQHMETTNYANPTQVTQETTKIIPQDASRQIGQEAVNDEAQPLQNVQPEPVIQRQTTTSTMKSDAEGFLYDLYADIYFQSTGTSVKAPLPKEGPSLIKAPLVSDTLPPTNTSPVLAELKLNKPDEPKNQQTAIESKHSSQQPAEHLPPVVEEVAKSVTHSVHSRKSNEAKQNSKASSHHADLPVQRQATTSTMRGDAEYFLNDLYNADISTPESSIKGTAPSKHVLPKESSQEQLNNVDMTKKRDSVRKPIDVTPEQHQQPHTQPVLDGKPQELPAEEAPTQPIQRLDTTKTIKSDANEYLHAVYMEAFSKPSSTKSAVPLVGPVELESELTRAFINKQSHAKPLLPSTETPPRNENIDVPLKPTDEADGEPKKLQHIKKELEIDFPKQDLKTLSSQRTSFASKDVTSDANGFLKGIYEDTDVVSSKQPSVVRAEHINQAGKDNIQVEDEPSGLFEAHKFTKAKPARKQTQQTLSDKHIEPAFVNAITEENVPKQQKTPSVKTVEAISPLPPLEQGVYVEHSKIETPIKPPSVRTIQAVSPAHPAEQAILLESANATSTIKPPSVRTVEAKSPIHPAEQTAFEETLKTAPETQKLQDKFDLPIHADKKPTTEPSSLRTSQLASDAKNYLNPMYADLPVLGSDSESKRSKPLLIETPTRVEATLPPLAPKRSSSKSSQKTQSIARVEPLDLQALPTETTKFKKPEATKIILPPYSVDLDAMSTLSDSNIHGIMGDQRLDYLAKNKLDNTLIPEESEIDLSSKTYKSSKTLQAIGVEAELAEAELDKVSVRMLANMLENKPLQRQDTNRSGGSGKPVQVSAIGATEQTSTKAYSKKELGQPEVKPNSPGNSRSASSIKPPSQKPSSITKKPEEPMLITPRPPAEPELPPPSLKHNPFLKKEMQTPEPVKESKLTENIFIKKELETKKIEAKKAASPDKPTGPGSLFNKETDNPWIKASQDRVKSILEQKRKESKDKKVSSTIKDNPFFKQQGDKK